MKTLITIFQTRLCRHLLTSIKMTLTCLVIKWIVTLQNVFRTSMVSYAVEDCLSLIVRDSAR